MLNANMAAGDALGSMLLRRIGSGGGIVAASFVDMDNLDQSSGFGRWASQQVGSRLGQHGFRMLDVRLGSELRMDVRQGEFLLSRDAARLLSSEYDAHAALVGVYTVSGSMIFVSARVVRLADNALLAAYEYYVPRDGDVAAFLGGASGGSGIWSVYAVRPRAELCTDPVRKSGAAPVQPRPEKDAAARPGGRSIDPAAVPAPLPGRKG
jgi:hypothetical protein